MSHAKAPEPAEWPEPAVVWWSSGRLVFVPESETKDHDMDLKILTLEDPPLGALDKNPGSLPTLKYGIYKAV